ncbi:hypothetical protein [Streptomyces sp. NBC_00354]|uniref:hypothetical protein n=1 Tax=Streptomyces sp. NBC_00354 TaxID=2975723 RepID=UPI002E25AED8
MTVLVVGVPEGEELERLRSRIQRNPHFQVISHARTPDIALAHARVLLPDITVLTLAGGFRDDTVPRREAGTRRGCRPRAVSAVPVGGQPRRTRTSRKAA